MILLMDGSYPQATLGSHCVSSDPHTLSLALKNLLVASAQMKEEVIAPPLARVVQSAVVGVRAVAPLTPGAGGGGRRQALVHNLVEVLASGAVVGQRCS